MKKYFIGIDLGGTTIKSSLFTEDYSIIFENRTSTEAEKGSDVVLKRMLANIYELLKNSEANIEEVHCMGIGVPGLLNVETGVSIFSPNFTNWENVQVVKWFQDCLGIPTYIDNDVRVNLFGEWYFGAGKGKKNIVLLTLGTGLGSGVIVDGHVLYGATGSVGEIGHMNMYRKGRVCKCGSSGCLGRYVSALGLLRTVREKIESGQDSILCDWTKNNLDKITAKMVSDAYDQNDKVAIDAFSETGEMLGYGLVNVINLYNPEMIIIGGGMSAASERLLSRTREIVDAHALKLSQSVCEITTASLGDRAGMLGAAIYASNRHALSK